MELPTDYDKLNRTEKQIVREEYVKLQEGKCYHCGKLLAEQPCQKILKKPVQKELFPQGFFKYPVHLHHNHFTGMTIGAVHSYCNAILWQYHGE